MSGNMFIAANQFRPMHFGVRHAGPMFIGGPNLSYTENITIKSGGNFWTGLLGALAGSIGGGGMMGGSVWGMPQMAMPMMPMMGGMNMGMMGMPMMGMSPMMGMPMMGMSPMMSPMMSPYGYLNAQQAQQQQQTDKEGDKQPKNDYERLQALFKDYNLTIVDDGKGKFTVKLKDGTLIRGTYKEVTEELSELEQDGIIKRTKSSTPADRTDDVDAADEGDDVEGAEESDDDGEDDEQPAVVSTKPHPNGKWTKVTPDSDFYKAFIDGEKKDASELTSDLIMDICGPACKFNADEQTQIRAFIIKQNPSVFKENGELKSGADMSKLDLPDEQWLKEEFGNFSARRQVFNDKHKYGASKPEKIVTGEKGRYAEKHGDKYEFYTRDGVQLPASYVKQHDPELYNQTQGKVDRALGGR